MDKGVITEIREDSEMPFTEDGEQTEIIKNILGVGNRLIFGLCKTFLISGES